MGRKPGQKAAIFAEKGRRLVRSWETMMLLAETTKALTAAEINERVHQMESDDQRCNIQTTREDLKTLQKCGFPVCKVDHDDNEIVDDGEASIGKLKNVRWRLRNPSKMGAFTSPYLRQPSSSDIVALSLCRALLKDEMPRQFPLRQSVDKILEELQLRLNKRLRFGDSVDIDLHDKVRRLGRQYVGKSILDSEWTKITTAIAKRQVLIADYENRAGEKRKVDIAPLAVWFSDGRAYVLAAGATDKKVRAWRIDRFFEMRVDSTRKPPKISEKEIEETLRTSFQGYISDPVKVQLKVRLEAAYLFREFEYHPTQEVKENDDGSLDVTMECAVGWAFEEWVLGFGELVVVKGSNELKKRLGTRVRELYELYCNG